MHSALLKLSNGHLFRIVPNAAVLHLVLGRKRLCDLLHHIRAAGLDHIIPGADTERRHADASAPVCHNKALKAPLIPEDCSSQVIVICRRHTIDIGMQEVAESSLAKYVQEMAEMGKQQNGNRQESL